MWVEMCSSDVGNIGETSNLKIEAAAIDSSKLQSGGAVVSYGIHDVLIVASVCLWRWNGREFDFGRGESEEATNTYQPSILEVWQGVLCIF
jgi:hypothetical protein